jgi:hypothetical protein
MFTFLHRLFRRMAVATRFDELVQPVGEAKCVRCLRVMLKAVRSQTQAQQHRPARCCHFSGVTLFTRRCSMQLRAKDLSRRWMSRDSAWDRSVKSRGD